MYVVESFVEEIRELSKTASPNLVSVLTSVCQFYALHGIVQDAGNFLAVSCCS